MMISNITLKDREKLVRVNDPECIGVIQIEKLAIAGDEVFAGAGKDKIILPVRRDAFDALRELRRFCNTPNFGQSFGQVALVEPIAKIRL